MLNAGSATVAGLTLSLGNACLLKVPSVTAPTMKDDDPLTFEELAAWVSEGTALDPVEGGKRASIVARCRRGSPVRQLSHSQLDQITAEFSHSEEAGICLLTVIDNYNRTQPTGREDNALYFKGVPLGPLPEHADDFWLHGGMRIVEHHYEIETLREDRKLRRKILRLDRKFWLERLEKWLADLPEYLKQNPGEYTLAAFLHPEGSNQPPMEDGSRERMLRAHLTDEIKRLRRLLGIKQPIEDRRRTTRERVRRWRAAHDKRKRA